MPDISFDNILAGMQPPRDFMYNISGGGKGSWNSTLISSLIPGGAISGNGPFDLPKNYSIISSSVADPTTITVNNHPWSDGDIISISGHTGSTPAVDGIYTITKTGTNTFTIPLSVTVGGSGGKACGKVNAGGPGLTGWPLTFLNGQIPFTNPPMGKSTYLTRLSIHPMQPSVASPMDNNMVFLLCDKLWHNGGISGSILTEQTFPNSVQIPPRDANGTSNGEGVYAALENAADGEHRGGFSIRYTNSKGFPNRVASTWTESLGWSVPSPIFTLAEGDTGIQKVESITFLDTYSTNIASLSLFLFRIVARMEVSTINYPNAIELLTAGLPRIYDNSVLSFIMTHGCPWYESKMGHIIWTQI